MRGKPLGEYQAVRNQDEVRTLKAEQILSISKTGDLFPYGIDMIKARYKELVKVWHPDINCTPGAAEVYSRITELYREALKLSEAGAWEKSNYILVSRRDDNEKIALNYDAAFDFELGTRYETKTRIAYVLGSDKKKYFENAVMRISGLKFQDEHMKADLSRFLPRILNAFQTKGGEYVILLEKPDHVISLKSVLAYFGGKLDDRHVAWIISRLCSLTCFLKYNKLVHNGININNCFISPDNHSILLLGGWWYTTGENEKMIGTSRDIFSIMPVAAKEDKKSSSLTDLESVKLMGRQLFGEVNCRKLSMDLSVPEPFIHFLTGGSGRDPYEEFVKWDRALNDSYGRRKFIHMEIKN
ncbi:MAG: hypothetical protein RHS_0925 [Robinsoniella sp. RHS]|nr:MAG: hypothetical protein RHS_0925 [Robinsoniella sp. RHS]